jgi:hypothetical protein
MKSIKSIPIWDKGQNKQADILNAFAVNVTLGVSATFYYTISNEQEQLASGNLTLQGEDYQLWEGDVFAWDWIAEQLNLTIIGDYVTPVVEEVVEAEPEPIVEPTEVESETEAEPTEPETEPETEPIEESPAES